MQHTQIIGIHNGNPALFSIIESECKSKKKRTVGIKKEFKFIKHLNNIDDTKNVAFDSSLISNDSIKIHDYELTLPSVDPTIFRFGKYKGKKILECTDLKYLMWYFDNITHSEIRSNVLRMLSNEYIYINNRFYNRNVNITPDDIEIINKCKNDENLIIRFDKNINDSGELAYGESGYIIIKFKDFKKQSFNGIHYGMAGNNDDHYVRTKNRELKITDYEFNFDDNINRYKLIVEKFEINA